MSKKIYLALCFVLISVLMTGCSSDTPYILGTWESTEIQGDSNIKQPVIFEFTEKNSVICGDKAFEYNMDDSSITFFDETGLTTAKYYIDRKILYVEYLKKDNTKVKMVFKKIKEPETDKK